jgi:hypothetical protein
MEIVNINLSQAFSYFSCILPSEPAAAFNKNARKIFLTDRLCGLVVRVPGYRSGGPGSIPGHYKKSSGSGTGSTQPREYN